MKLKEPKETLRKPMEASETKRKIEELKETPRKPCPKESYKPLETK